MIYALEERIGDPLLFCGRKQEMELLMNWVESIPRKMAKSRALLGRRKCGKSAIMQRLFNIFSRSHAPRGNACTDAPRPVFSGSHAPAWDPSSDAPASSGRGRGQCH
jgi:hypothetical protein